MPSYHQHAQTRPSELRRKRLNAELGEDGNTGSCGTPLVSNFFPLDRYYEAADKVYESFNYAYNKKELDDAYVFGKRYCSFCVDGIPRHSYYKAPKYTNLRLRHIGNVQQVLERLNEIVLWMDEEEAHKEKLRQEQIARHQRMMEQKRLEMEKKKYEELQKRMARFSSEGTKGASTVGVQDVQMSALKKLEMLGKQNTTIAPQPPPLPPPLLPPQVSASTPEEMQISTPDDETKPSSAMQQIKHEQDEFHQCHHAADSTASSTTRKSTGTSRYALDDTDEDDEEMENEASVKTTGLFNQLKSASQQPMPPPVPPSTQSISASSSSPPDPNGAAPPKSSAALSAITQTQTTMPPPPPSYDQALTSTRRNPFLGPSSNESSSNNSTRTVNWNGMPTDPPSNRTNGDNHRHQQPQAKEVKPYRPKKRVPIRTLQREYYNDYIKLLKHQKRISIQNVSTYQGRVRSSTNGCTVISALIVSKHLSSPYLHQGVTNPDICNVIDRDAGPVLYAIRSKLGLSGDSLIIPSDVHDHLVDEKLLQQEFFIGATGGDVLNREHMQEVLNLLSCKTSSSPQPQDDSGSDDDPPPPPVPKKAGATFFFREHVISIVKTYIKGQQLPCYDLIDSMPSSNGCGTRTRCHDLEALDVLLKYYTSKKFGDSNCNYIDRNEWNESMADLDPRVFQAFVWAR